MDYLELCLSLGAHKAVRLATEALTFSEVFRDYCEQNTCGRYARNYTCPPYIGEIADCIAKVKSRETAVVFQTVHALEDSYDFEGMMRGQKIHNEITRRAAEQAPGALILGAGGCFLCEKCGALTGEPCRFPGKAISSLEAHGIDVSKIGAISDLKYINGPNTVTYFSGLFYNEQ